MKLLLYAQQLLVVITLGTSFVLIPDDIVPILNILYSRLPAPIRIGMDNTKVGFGFRMGRNVDVQTLFELGPQNSTPAPTANTLKRHAHETPQNRGSQPSEFWNLLRTRQPSAKSPVKLTHSSTTLRPERLTTTTQHSDIDNEIDVSGNK